MENDLSIKFISNDSERISRNDKIGKFHEGRAKVYKKGLIGFIDTDGNFITPIRWEDASDFCEGLACVADPESGNYGFINKEGKVTIPFVWSSAHPFKNNQAEVSDEDGNWYLIDKEGKIIR